MGLLCAGSAGSRLGGVRSRLVCEECGREAEEAARGWQAHMVDLDDDGLDEVVFYCACCSEREFGCAERAG